MFCCISCIYLHKKKTGEILTVRIKGKAKPACWVATGVSARGLLESNSPDPGPRIWNGVFSS